MQTAILTVHIIICITLVVLVLLQAGREGMGIIFGGSGSSNQGSVQGGILTKLTAFLAVLFVVTSLSYNIMTSSSKVDESQILNVQFEEVVVVPPTASEPAQIEAVITEEVSESPAAAN